MSSEPRYALTDEERAALRPGLNVDALERLLGHLDANGRKAILPYFSMGLHAGILGAADPEMDALVEEVWAPVSRSPDYPQAPERE